ncbi:amidohydrolase [Flavobacteriaceae bacterium AH-315-B10]|nr:amidohydrolase [Flavobacteriaceae bacterium AH-315-B10]
MQNELTIAIIQADLVWENPLKNRYAFLTKIEALPEDIDLIVLPEMFTTGFTMNALSVAETMEGDTLKWMQYLAVKKQAAIVGSIIINENNKFYNRLFFVHPTREIEYYDKRHTFTLAGEHKVFTSGKKKMIVEYKGWKICPLICYDLRFPVWSRNVENYDLLLYVANWPKPRITAWDALLKARAIENMSYCIGVNRVGQDSNNNEYSGHSLVYDALGKQLSNFIEDKEMIEIVTLSKENLTTIKEKLKFLDDRDRFIIP